MELLLSTLKSNKDVISLSFVKSRQHFFFRFLDLFLLVHNVIDYSMSNTHGLFCRAYPEEESVDQI